MQTIDCSRNHRSSRSLAHTLAGAIATAVLSATLMPDPASAQRLENGVAVFAALDKVTAKIKRLEVPLNETVAFGALQITPRVCFSRPATERPKTTTFVEINETQLDGANRRLFSGWMFAQSPGLNAVEHPVFDIWLTGCEKPKNIPAANTAAQAGGDPDAASATGQIEPKPFVRRRPRRRVRR